MKTKVNQSLRYVAIVAVAVLCYTVLFQTTFYWIVYGSQMYEIPIGMYFYSVSYNYAAILVFALGVLYTNTLTRRLKYQWLKILIDGLAGGAIYVATEIPLSIISDMEISWGGSLFNIIILWLALEYWLLSEQKKDALIRENLLQQENNRMKYEILQAYVNPHFLYNSLNMLCSLIEDDEKEQAEEFIYNLSGYYRQMTRRMNIATSTFGEELSMVKRYMDIMKYHYDNCLELEVSGDDSVEVPMVPFSLQLLIENVLKHNYINESKPMKIGVTITDSHIIVSNRINPKPKTENRSKGGVGLSYLNTLYKFHGQELLIEEMNGKFSVSLPIIS